MIWEQTINLTRPLRSVRLATDKETILDGDCVPPVEDVLQTRSRVDSPADAGGPPIAGDNQSHATQLLESLVTLLQEQQQRGQQTIRELQIVAIEVATAVAERLFLSQVGKGELELERLVNEALSHLQGTGPVVVRLHPDDVRSLQGASLAIPTSDMALVADDSLQRGNCQVDGTAFGVRFDWAAQLEELRRRMLQELMDAHADN